MHEIGSFIISLENVLSHVNVFNAHIIEHIQVKDSINISHDRKQRHIIIESYLLFIFNTSRNIAYKTLSNDPIRNLQLKWSCEAP